MSAPKPDTPLPWFVGSWGGQCHKPEHAGNHPGPEGDNPCIYDPVKHIGYGIASEAGEDVVSTSYDELVISDADAAYIVHACNTFPKLVEALEVALDVMEAVDGENDCSRGIAAVEGALDAAKGDAK